MPKRADWDSVEPLYRAGNLSNNEICRQYEADHKNSQTYKRTITESAIRKRAREKGWKRDLADKVRKQVRENVVRSSVRSEEGSYDVEHEQELIEKAAEAGSQVVLRHQKEIAALLAHENKLLDELYGDPKKLHHASFQGVITSKEVELTVKEKSATLKDLASVRAQRIQMERQAHDIDSADSNKGESFEEFLRGIG